MAAMLTGIASAADGNLDSFVSKDKVWHYELVTYMDWNPESVESGITLRFQPADTVINGKEYSILVSTNCREEKPDTVAFMRQDGRELFILCDEGFNGWVYDENCGYGNVNRIDTEVKLFDFDAEAGDEYEGIVVGDFIRYADLKVTCVDKLRINGLELGVQRLARSPNEGGVLAIEGIGVDSPFWFFMPGVGDVFSDTERKKKRYYLKCVTDTTGRVLFDEEDFGRASVRFIQNDLSEAGRIYDLNGREIRDPEPGTIYIQGGHKHVAPRR